MKIEKNNVRIYIGEIIDESGWDEKEGPTPMPKIDGLREWDRTLLARYRPVYVPVRSECSFCAFGPCDLNANRKGACGMNSDVQSAREALFLTVTGAATHAAHARHVLDYFIDKGGKNAKLNVAKNTEVAAPLTRLIAGIKPETIGDLLKPMEYVEEQLTGLLASLHIGQESDDIDFGSKTLHAGMVDSLAMEIADIIQISLLGFPKGDADTDLIDIGFSSVDVNKPVVLAIGHNIASGSEIIDYAKKTNEDVEIAGLCCTSHDMARHHSSSKIVGPLSYQLPYIRSGIADVIVTDEQCIRIDTIENASKLGIPVISTSDKSIGGFRDLSGENADMVVDLLVSGKVTGAYIPRLEKAAEIAIKTAIKIHGRRKPKSKDSIKEVDRCIACGLCVKACPVGNDVRRIITTLGRGGTRGVEKHAENVREEMVGLLGKNAYSPTELAKQLDVSRQYVYKVIDSLGEGVYHVKVGKDVYYSLSKQAIEGIKAGVKEKLMSEAELMSSIERCVFCGRCESWCPQKIPIVSVFADVLRDRLMKEKSKIRAGRGAIRDVEIRDVGKPLVFGEIPGIIAIVGCPFYPEGARELVDIAETFLQRGFIVTTSGCSAMTLGIEGNLYEKYPGAFDAGNLVNVGSCVANAHIIGAAVKVANIFAKRSLRGNFEEIADYILNRVGAVGIVWGAMSQKALAIATGCNRVGIPVILGPSGGKYRRELKSDGKTDWNVFDTRGEGKYDVGPVPEHLFYVAKTKQDAIINASKFVMRASDGMKGRQIKLAHYIDLYERHNGRMPPDVHRFVRNEKDIPVTIRDKVMGALKKQNWEPVEKIPDPTLLRRLSGGVKNG